MSNYTRWPISPKRPRTTNLFRGNVRDYLLVAQVAERLGVSRTKVVDLINDGKLEGMREGRLWLVEELSVRNYARSRCRD